MAGAGDREMEEKTWRPSRRYSATGASWLGESILRCILTRIVVVIETGNGVYRLVPEEGGRYAPVLHGEDKPLPVLVGVGHVGEGCQPISLSTPTFTQAVALDVTSV